MQSCGVKPGAESRRPARRRRGRSTLLDGAEGVAQRPDQIQDLVVADAVVDLVGVLARRQDALVAQDGEVLGDVALRRADLLHDILYTHLGRASQDAQYLEAQGVRHGLERARGVVDVLLAGDKKVFHVFGGYAHVFRPHAGSLCPYVETEPATYAAF